MRTIWVFGDQCNESLTALADAVPGQERILFVESEHKIEGRPWHRQRLHFIISSMRHFAEELRRKGHLVDYRIAPTMSAGVADHRSEFSPGEIVATEPNSFTARRIAHRLGVVMVPSNQFLTTAAEFATWADGRKSLKMEDFYRRQRMRLGYLMDGDQPVGGQWNFDHENRQPPPRKGPYPWPEPLVDELDDIDRAVIEALPASCPGEAPIGLWGTSREAALRRLSHFVENLLPMFGPHEDAMLSGNWHLAHSLLSPYLNNGLLHPAEVCDAVQRAFNAGQVPVASAEGFIRQVIGWREYVWNLYWLWGEDYAASNVLAAHRPLPRMFSDGTTTSMNCVSRCIGDVHARGWAHHIQRLMILGNLSLLAGVDPAELTNWMWENFVDGAEWVMVPNVVGMSLHADGGKMATKPYASGGAYVDKMSDYCKACTFDRKKRTGDDACPFTTLYWDFLARHGERFVRNPRVSAQVRSAQKLVDLDAVQNRAAEVLSKMDLGRL